MGNFSRNTFDPAKGYIGVRLQQGVPLVDADWNELNDVTRHELYQSLDIAFPSGIPPASSFSFAVIAGFFGLPAIDNDFYVFPGQALVRGRSLNVPLQDISDVIRYSTQPWADATRAAEDGVDVIPPLTTPAADRTDLVYLDLWEREVNSDEDPDLINPVIGVETCVRLKQEVTIRVAEGTTTLPAAPDGHALMPLARLNRPSGQAALTGSGVIQDIRPVFNGLKGTREVSFAPIFTPFTLFGTSTNWLLITFPQETGGFGYAFKPASETAGGVLPLAFPPGAQLTRLEIRGYTRRSVAGSTGDPNLAIWLLRSNSTQTLFETDGTTGIPNMDTLLQEEIPHNRTDTQRVRFNRFFTIPSDERQNIVDSDHYYSLLANSSNSDFEVIIQGISVSYTY